MNVRGFAVCERGEYGFWKVKGADRSDGGLWDRVDMPFMGYYEGYYQDVLEVVSKRRGWKVYNKVGIITKIEVIKLGD